MQASLVREHGLDSSEVAGPRSTDVLARYSLALLTAVLALIVRGVFTPWLGTHNPYHTVWAAVVLAAWYFGVGPAILTTLVSAVGVWFWFLPPGRSFLVNDPREQIVGTTGFLIMSAFIIAFGESNRRSKERSAIEIRQRTATENRLRARESELEALQSVLADRVEERTTELNSAIAGLRQLSARLLQAQDDERRRIARELHDSVGQLLAAITMNLQILRTAPLTPEAAAAVEENGALVDQISSEIRTMSHLLHPPLLDEVGLASSLQWYIEGFSARSKILVNLKIAGDFGRLSNDMEIAIFRMVQECLTNVHRHSGSDTGEVHLKRDAERVWVEINDKGKGIPLDKQRILNSSQQAGVGFRGMRERIQQLGGRLEIRSDEHGTTVKATMPIPNAAPTFEREVA